MSEKRRLQDLQYGSKFKATDYDVNSGTLIRRGNHYFVTEGQDPNTSDIRAHRIRQNIGGFFVGTGTSISSISARTEVIYLGGLAEGVWKNNIAPPLARETKKNKKKEEDRPYGFIGFTAKK